MADGFDLHPYVREGAPTWFCDALRMPFEQRQVDVGGCSINFLQWGPATSRGVVFIHGGGAHAHWWTHIAATFAGSVRVVAIDLSGHGDSGRRGQYSLETWTEEVIAVTAAAGIEQPTLVGHSMGGFVTAATAARYPDLCTGAVIVDSPITEIDAEVSAARSRRTSPTSKVYPDLDEAIARFRTIPEQAHYLDFVIDHVARRSLVEVDGGWQWKFDPSFWYALSDSPRTTALPYLSEIACRVALIRCEDGLVNLDIGRSMYDAMGRRTPVVELPTAGHHPMLDTPLLLLTALRSLFADWLHSDPRPRAK